MRQEILAVILVILVAGSLGVGFLAGVNNRQTTTSVSTDTTTLVNTHVITSTTVSTTTRTQSALAGTGCSTPVRPPPAGTNDTNLFYLSDPSEAAICVTYEYQGNGNATFGSNVLYVTGGGGITATSCAVSPCPGLNMTASPTAVQFKGTTNITVTYRFSTFTGLQKGLYWLWGNSCGPVAVLVYGQNYTRINVGGLGSTIGCYVELPLPLNIWVVGVSNMIVSAVPVYE